ncbi:hypothetical protein OG898_16480 [Streptomyces sp. NBC_00193]|uniref:hypothetical protein n=1 Tax=unclassified Streptomyces TaxID=2593676 RepID=UPI0022577A56|nr:MULTISPECIES: hypothetical protein [unclassified Streptomyces]MCX5124882.1 hypothetical protein [Streptomyces sp. NBC_00347]MCX5298064.1 hypothetical protein [Streptomyces sp. NBC_00193]
MKADESGFEITQQQGSWVIRMWWPTGSITGGPQRMTLEPVDGAEPRDVARGISTTVLRRLDIAAALNLAKKAPEAQRTLEDLSRQVEATGEAAGRLLAAEGVSERYLATLTLAYSAMAESGAPAPIPWLARLIERRPETVKDHLKKARRDGYLGTLAGKAGGEVTDKAKAALGLDGEQ